MKKISIIILTILLMVSCVKVTPEEEKEIIGAFSNSFVMIMDNKKIEYVSLQQVIIQVKSEILDYYVDDGFYFVYVKFDKSQNAKKHLKKIMKVIKKHRKEFGIELKGLVWNVYDFEGNDVLCFSWRRSK